MSVTNQMQELRVDTLQPKKNCHGCTDKRQGNARTSASYTNAAYVGSMTNVSDARRPIAPPNCVIREQYWACSKWPQGQRILLITVAILLGMVIGLSTTMIVTGKKPDAVIGEIFNAPSVPG